MSRKIKIKIQEQIDRNQLNSIVDQMDIDAAKGALKALSDEQLNQVVAYLADPEKESQLESLLESFTGLTEEIIIEHKFYNLYDALQDAIDENGEKPCPQCLYEVLSAASCGCPDLIPEAKYRGKKVTLNKPKRGGSKKFYVYVKNAKGNVVKVSFGDPNMRIKKSNPKRRKSFRARHNCKNPGPKWKARYWSCRKW